MTQPRVTRVTAPPRKLGVVVNPTAGKGRGAIVGDAVIKRLHDDGHDIWNLSGHSVDLAQEHAKRAVAQGLDALVVVGGDGMVHLGIQAVGGTNTPLGIIPVGTGNDFATVLGLPIAEPSRAVAQFTAALAAGPTGIKSIDLIYVTGAGLGSAEQGQWVAGAVSAGIDAAINARANAMIRPRGSSRYTIAALRELAAYRAWPYLVTMEHAAHTPAELERILKFPGVEDLGPEPNGDGHRIRWQGLGALVTVANSPVIGGGLLMAPGASLTDGYLDVVIAGDVGKSGAAKLFPAIMAGGKHADSKDIRIIRAKVCDVQPGSGTANLPAAYADGEYLGTLPLVATIRHGALKVLVAPPSAAR